MANPEPGNLEASSSINGGWNWMMNHIFCMGNGCYINQTSVHFSSTGGQPGVPGGFSVGLLLCSSNPHLICEGFSIYTRGPRKFTNHRCPPSQARHFWIGDFPNFPNWDFLFPNWDVLMSSLEGRFYDEKPRFFRKPLLPVLSLSRCRSQNALQFPGTQIKWSLFLKVESTPQNKAF